jgi:hypothetical protein
MAISNNSTGLRTGVCTSTTRPTTPYTGQVIYETDTSLTSVWNGTTWVGTTSAATTANGNGGHSNIYSNSTVTYAATIVSAVRRVQGVTYVFKDLTFYMPTTANTDASDWTAPVNSSTYKWSYVYIRPSDNKFYISNTAPAAGLNYKTIGGSLVVYLFPAYTSSSIIQNFQLDNSKYSCDQPYNARTTYRTYDTGVQLNYDWGGGNRTTGTANVTAAIPTSATELYIGFRNAYGWRDDSGNTRYYSISLDVQNKSGTWVQVYSDDGYMYCRTPDSGGAYFLRTVCKSVELTLSTNTYNFAATRMTWSHSCTTGDADTGAGFWLKGFNDGNIF